MIPPNPPSGLCQRPGSPQTEGGGQVTPSTSRNQAAVRHPIKQAAEGGRAAVVVAPFVRHRRRQKLAWTLCMTVVILSKNVISISVRLDPRPLAALHSSNRKV